MNMPVQHQLPQMPPAGMVHPTNLDNISKAKQLLPLVRENLAVSR